MRTYRLIVFLTILLIVLITTFASAQKKENGFKEFDKKRNTRTNFKKTLNESLKTNSEKVTAILATGTDVVAIHEAAANALFEKTKSFKRSEKFFYNTIRYEAFIAKTLIKKLDSAYQAGLMKIANDATLGNEQRKADEKKIEEAWAKGTLEVTINRNRRGRALYKAYRLKTSRFLPAKNSLFAKLYYDDLASGELSFLSNSSLIYGDDLEGFTSNIVSGYPFVPIRFSLSTVVAKGRSEEVDAGELVGKNPAEVQAIVNDVADQNVKNNTLAHVLNGGGILTLKAEYPIWSINGYNRLKPSLTITSSAAFSGEFGNGIGSVEATEANTFQYIGGEVKFLLPFNNIDEDENERNAFSFFLALNTRYIKGSDTFESNLNISSAFTQFDYSMGVVFGGIKVSYTYLNFSEETLNDLYTSRISIGYAPRLIN